MRQYNICDFHGHFLPEMDDGSQSVAESLQMLQLAKKQGIGKMFATPHYYSDETVAEFLSRRQDSWQKLSAAMGQEKTFPQIVLGAEVAYRQGIGNAQDLELLCLGNSRYLLLELPFGNWDGMLFRDISAIANVRGIIPVIAHIERYLQMQPQKQIQRLLEQDVLVQMNASVLLSWRSRGEGKKLLKNGIVHLLGSDCHNMSTRQPNLGQAVDYLVKCRMEDQLAQVGQFGEEIFCQATETR